MLIRLTGVVLSIVLVAGLAGSAEAQQRAKATPAKPVSIKISAVGGQEIRLRRVISLQNDCKSYPLAAFVVLSPPQNGALVSREIEDHPSFEYNNARYHCNKLKVPAGAAFYTARQGFTGVDRLRFAFVYFDGDAVEFDVEISIWR